MQEDRFKQARRNAIVVLSDNQARNIAASIRTRGRSPEVDALLLTPERLLKNPDLQAALAQSSESGDMCMFVVDECHLCLTWGMVRTVSFTQILGTCLLCAGARVCVPTYPALDLSFYCQHCELSCAGISYLIGVSTVIA